MHIHGSQIHSIYMSGPYTWPVDQCYTTHMWVKYGPYLWLICIGQRRVVVYSYSILSFHPHTRKLGHLAEHNWVRQSTLRTQASCRKFVGCLRTKIAIARCPQTQMPCKPVRFSTIDQGGLKIEGFCIPRPIHTPVHTPCTCTCIPSPSSHWHRQS